MRVAYIAHYKKSLSVKHDKKVIIEKLLLKSGRKK